MKIAVASGKGGTGKTSVAVNLALSMGKVQVLDCDVEEPNVHILLRPKVGETFPVELLVPKILEERCDYCGDCAKFCQFNALFVAGETAMVFPVPQLRRMRHRLPQGSHSRGAEADRQSHQE